MRLYEAIFWTVAGGAMGAFVGMIVVVGWTLLFSRGVPIRDAWEFTARTPTRAVFAVVIVGAATIVGLIWGLVRGLRTDRGRRDDS